MVCACTPGDSQEMWETFPCSALLDCQTCPVSKTSQKTIQAFAVLAILSYCCATGKARKQMHSSGQWRFVYGQRSSSGWDQGDLAGGASCAAPWLPTGGTMCKDPREEKRREGLGLGAGNSGKQRSQAGHPWCHCHRQLAGLSSSWGQGVCWESCQELPSHQFVSHQLGPSLLQNGLCVRASLVWLECAWQSGNKQISWKMKEHKFLKLLKPHLESDLATKIFLHATNCLGLQSV